MVSNSTVSTSSRNEPPVNEPPPPPPPLFTLYILFPVEEENEKSGENQGVLLIFLTNDTLMELRRDWNFFPTRFSSLEYVSYRHALLLYCFTKGKKC